MTVPPATRRAGLQAMTRNNYFHGQLLGVENFDRELAYLNGHRRQLTRTVSGTGVVCGIDVELSRDGTHIRLTPGLAVDRWGREIVVPRRSDPLPIPEQAFADAVDDAATCVYDPTIHVVLCYHECRSDPAPVLAGDCDTPDPCAPSCIREQYRLEFRPGPAEHPDPVPQVPGLVANGRVDHAALATWVTRGRAGCTTVAADPCLVLANIVLADTGDRGEQVDITVRRVLLSSAALLQLVLAAVTQAPTSTYTD